MKKITSVMFMDTNNKLFLGDTFRVHEKSLDRYTLTELRITGNVLAAYGVKQGETQQQLLTEYHNRKFNVSYV